MLKLPDASCARAIFYPNQSQRDGRPCACAPGTLKRLISGLKQPRSPCSFIIASFALPQAYFLSVRHFPTFLTSLIYIDLAYRSLLFDYGFECRVRMRTWSGRSYDPTHRYLPLTE